MSSSSLSNIAAQFVRESLRVQIGLAKQVQSSLQSDIYLFDITGRFDGAETILVSNIRVLKTQSGLYAVLGQAAQAVFKTTNTYSQYIIDTANISVTFESVVLEYGSSQS